MDKKTHSKYINQLSEAKKAINSGDVDKLKSINDSTCIKGDLRKYIQSEENPFRKTNAVILACKANQPKALEYLLSNESRIIANSSGVVLPTYQDETFHNAFYYAIRSGNLELFQMLISRWPKNYFKNHPQELDEIISSSYEELKLNNVLLSNEMKLFIEKLLIELRFSTASSKRSKNVNQYIKTTKERANIVIDTVKALKDEYSTAQKVDEQCLYKMKFVAQNINVLKQMLKSTYDRLPWEEIEFCLIVFISTNFTHDKINIYSKTCLDDDKIISHLVNFTNRFESEMENMKAPSIRELTAPVKQKRSKVVKCIMCRCPEFESLYALYHQLRDIYSLEKISETLKLGLDADVKEREGRILVARILQVLGEYMKNTLQSPKLSDSSIELLLASLTKSSRKLILTLRNSLSHIDSLFKRTEIENNKEESFFDGILKDLGGIGYIVNDMLRVRKDDIFSMLINKAANVETYNDCEKVLKICGDNFKLGTIDNEFNSLLSDRIKELIEELSAAIPDQTAYEKHFFKQVISECDSIKQLLTDLNDQRHVFIRLLQFCGSNEEFFEDMTQLELFKQNFKTKPISYSFAVGKISFQLENILKSLKARTQPSSDVQRIVYRLLDMMPKSDLKWIEDLEYKLNEEELPLKNTTTLTYECFNRELLKKKKELERILNKCRPSSQSLSTFFDVYKRDKKTQNVVEMLVLDIVSIMATLNMKNIGRDFFFVDDICPVLVGKCLRNHLAHHNELVNLVLDDPDRVIFLNALKLIEEFDESEECKEYKENNISTIKTTRDTCLRILKTKQHMFAACEEGKIDSLKIFLQNGADVNSRCREGYGILHFTIKCGSIDLLTFLLDIDKNVSVSAHELEVAVANGRRNVVEFIVNKIGMPTDGMKLSKTTLLHIAAKNGHKDVVEFLIKNKSDPKRYDQMGMPIHYAVFFNHKSVVEFLLKSGLNTIDDKSVGGHSLLYRAVEYGYTDLVGCLLELGANVNEKVGNDCVTPLNVAVARGHLKLVKMLVAKGADVNSRMLNGLSPLYSAVNNNHLEIATFLLENNADVNTAGIMYRNTPLHIACENGYKNIAELLLKKGADVNVYNVDGKSPMHFAVAGGHCEIFSILLAYGSDMYAKTKQHWTLLHCVAASGQQEIADKLIKSLKVDAKSVDDVTPLHIAALYGFAGMVEIFINNNASINSRDCGGRTPLHAAASKNHKEVIETLIKRGAELDVINDAGISPLCLAVMENHDDAIFLLIEHGAAVTYDEFSIVDLTPLNMAIIKGNIKVLRHMVCKYNLKRKYLSSQAADLAVKFGHKDILKFLLLHGDGVSILRDGFKLLRTAITKNNKAIVKLLMESVALENEELISELLFESVTAGHADIAEMMLKKCDSVDNFFDNGEPLLLRAARRGYIKIFKNVLQKCENVDIAWQQGTTALHIATSLGNKEMVEILLDRGAKVNVECYDGTPLHMAAVKMNNTEIVKLLLSRGADINFEDRLGRSALNMAVSYNKLEIVKEFFSGSSKIFVNHVESTEGLTSLHIAAQYGCMDIIRYLIEQGADINIRNKYNAKPIHHAAREGHVEIVKFFISKGSSINEVAHENQTLLHYATMKGHIKLVEYLISENVDLNAQTISGLTPLNYCVLFGYKEIAKLLLNNSAIYNAADNRNNKPKDMGVGRGLSISAEIFKTDPDATAPAVKVQHEIVEMLTVTDNLLKAVKRNDILEVEKCIKLGAIPNAKDLKGNMPLHYASWMGYAPIVEVLLHAKANVNACLRDGSTALHYSVKYSHVNIVKMLLSYGAIYNLKNCSKATPLDLATENSIKDILRLTSDLFKYVDRGSKRVIDELGKIKDSEILRAVVNARNENNKTLLMAAKQCDFPKLEELIDVLFGDQVISMNRAYNLSIQESYTEALNIYRNVLEQMQAKLGPDNFVLLRIKERIGGLLFKQHKYNEALRILREVCKLQTEFLEPDHLDAMSTKSTIALVLHALGKNNEALEIYNDIYPKQKSLLKPTSQELFNTQLHMALVLQAMHMFDEALKLNNEYYEVVRRTMGEHHMLTLNAKNNIARVLNSMGKHDEAIKIFEEVHVKRKLKLGPHHSDTLRPLHNIATVYFTMSRYEDATKLLKQVFEIQKKVLGVHHRDTLNTQCNIGQSLFRQGNTTAAHNVFKSFLRNAKSILEPTHPDILIAQQLLDAVNKCLEKTESKDLLDHLDDMQRNLNNAALNGTQQTLVDLINNGVNINYVDEAGRSALYYAVYGEKLEIIKILLKHSANVFQVTNKCNTLLHVAVLKNNHEIIEFLLQYAEGEKHNKIIEFINTRTITTGSTALHVAAKNGSYEIVRSLLKRGAAFDIKNNDGLKPSEVSQNEAIRCLFAFIEDIFENALNGNAGSVKNKLETGQPEQVNAAIRTRNFQGITLLQAVLTNCERNVAFYLVSKLKNE